MGVINRLKHDIENFKELLPIIKSLSSPALTEDHWKKLTEIAKLEEALNPNVETVETLVEKGLNDYKDEIEVLSINA